MSKAITKEDMALLKEAGEMFNETGCVPGIDGEQVPAERIVPDAKTYISETECFATGQGSPPPLDRRTSRRVIMLAAIPRSRSAAIRCSIHSMGPTRMCCAFAKQKLAASTIKWLKLALSRRKQGFESPRERQ